MAKTKMTRILTATLPNGETFRKEIAIKNSMSCDYDFATAYRCTAEKLREDARQEALGYERLAAYTLAKAEAATDDATATKLLADAARYELRVTELRTAVSRISEPGPWYVDNFTRYIETASPAAAELRRDGYDVEILHFENRIVHAA